MMSDSGTQLTFAFSASLLAIPATMLGLVTLAISKACFLLNS